MDVLEGSPIDRQTDIDRYTKSRERPLQRRDARFPFSNPFFVSCE